MDIPSEFKPLAFWVGQKSGSLNKASRVLAVANRVLQVMSRDPEVNPGSLSVASAFLCSLERRGLGAAPIPSVDADGDVVFTWSRGNLRGSAMITETGISSIVSEGRDIAYLTEEVPMTEKAIEDSSFITMLGVGQGWQPNFQSSSLTWTLSGDKYSSQECSTSTLTFPVQHTPRSSNLRRKTGEELSQSSGEKRLVWKHVTSSES